MAGDRWSDVTSVQELRLFDVEIDGSYSRARCSSRADPAHSSDAAGVGDASEPNQGPRSRPFIVASVSSSEKVTRRLLTDGDPGGERWVQ